MRMIQSLILSTLGLLSLQAYAFDLTFVSASEQVYAHPHDLVLSADRRYLYVADNGNDRIVVLDANTLKLVGTFGEDQLDEPHDVALLSGDQLFVADTGNSRIAIYKVSGKIGVLIGELRGAIRRPEGVAVTSNGRVYATGAASNNIELFEKGKSVAITAGLSSPHDVSIAADGSLWIADANNDRLVQMSQDLKIKRILQGAPYHFSGPRYLDFDSQGRLYVADKYNHQVKVLGTDLRLLTTVGTGKAGMGPGKFDRPEGITIHGEDVWFSDTYNDRIVRYRIND